MKLLYKPAIILFCLLAGATQAVAQAGSANYMLTAGALVGGGGGSGSVNYAATGSVPLSGAVTSGSDNYIAFGGIINSVSIAYEALLINYTGTPVMTIPAGTAREILVRIMGGEGLDTSGTVYYRFGGQIDYQTAAMSVDAANIITDLTGDLLGVRGLEYFIKIKVGDDSLFIGSPDEPYIFITSLTNAQGQRPSPMPDADYRIIGVPIDPASTLAENIFEDDLGAYDPMQWRFGKYNPVSFEVDEYTGGEIIVPGTGYWLIARGNKTYGTAGTSIRPDDEHDGQLYYRVPLENGWNQMGNPLPFNVAWDDILFDDNGTVSGHDTAILDDVAHYYSGTEYLPYDYLPAWEGAFVFIKKGGVTAMIPWEQAGLTPPGPKETPLLPDGGWAVGLRLEAGGLVDDNNLAGIRPDASVCDDNYDLHEPPPPPQGPSLAFILPGQNTSPRLTDMRPPFDDGAVWTISLHRAAGGHLRVAHLETLPPRFEAWLRIDGHADIKLDPTVDITIPDETTEARLVIGTPAYIARHIPTTVPLTFTLDQNYPNPFNPTTRITFSLPTAGPTHLRVLNLLGQTVRTLIDRDLPAGRFETVWDGTSTDGSRAASGVYFYELQQAASVQIRKMMLLK